MKIKDVNGVESEVGDLPVVGGVTEDGELHTVAILQHRDGEEQSGVIIQLWDIQRVVDALLSFLPQKKH